jgi:hypothetical protein
MKSMDGVDCCENGYVRAISLFERRLCQLMAENGYSCFQAEIQAEKYGTRNI